MNEKSRKLILIFSICLNIGFIIAASYTIYRHSGYRSNIRHFSKLNSSAIFEVVDLDPRQKTEIDQLVQVFHANMMSISKSLAPLKAKMLERMAASPTLSEADAKEIIDEMNALQNKRGELTYHHLKALRQSLTDNQATTVFRHFAEIQNRWARKVKSQP